MYFQGKFITSVVKGYCAHHGVEDSEELQTILTIEFLAKQRWKTHKRLLGERITSQVQSSFRASAADLMHLSLQKYVLELFYDMDLPEAINAHSERISHQAFEIVGAAKDGKVEYLELVVSIDLAEEFLCSEPGTGASGELLEAEPLRPALKNGKYRAGDFGGSCAVCIEEFLVAEDIALTPCCHGFHESCIIQWLLNGGSSCPICRGELPDLL